ncbi:MAG: CotH kinase family protein [Candidatus Omnitrophica bacterium]|nr:CotH kinase family protein [Candidatus Omnitrophota bacterium]
MFRNDFISAVVFVCMIFPTAAGIASPRAGISVCINEILASNASVNIDPYFKEFSCWVELYNYGSREVNLSGYYLTDSMRKRQKWQIPPATVIPPKGFLLFWADRENVYDHTNFRLDPMGEALCLTDPKGMIIDELAYIRQISDVSFGRYPDGGPGWFYFAAPTPKESNITERYSSQRRAASPEFSLKGGFYPSALTLKITGPKNGIIRYTTDGSIPDEKSGIYNSPLKINSTAVVRARTFYPGIIPSPVATKTYFINERFTLPVVSVAMNPSYLWDSKTGIYVMGENAKPEFPYWGANFREKWERPANIEFYEKNGKQGFNIEAGVRTAGATSLTNPVKSLAVRMRQKYGTEEINYRIFDNRPFTKFRSLLLTNSSDDWASTVFRDNMIKKLFEGRMNIDYQVNRPVVVFINGKYWAVQYISEKIDEYFLASNHDIDPAKIDLLAYYPDPEKLVFRRIIAGKADDYDRLMDFISDRDLSISENYRHIEAQIDIDEFLDYVCAEIYIANYDWPGGNMKFWKLREKKAKWRWILYDTGIAFGRYAPYSADAIKHATAVSGTLWANPPQSTLMFRKLFANPEFRNDFIQRMASHLNTTFKPERITGIIEICKDEIKPEMPRYIEKWQGHASDYIHLHFPSTIEQWESNVDSLRVFARERPHYMRSHIMKNFSLNGGTAVLSMQIKNPEGGKIFIGGVHIPDAEFKGIYFKGVPMRMEAVPSKGYRFLGWAGMKEEGGLSVSIVMENNTAVRAVFEPVKKF